MLCFHGNPEGSRRALGCQCDCSGEEKARWKNNREEGHFTIPTVLERDVGLGGGGGDERRQAPSEARPMAGGLRTHQKCDNTCYCDNHPLVAQSSHPEGRKHLWASPTHTCLSFPSKFFHGRAAQLRGTHRGWIQSPRAKDWFCLKQRSPVVSTWVS